MQRSLDGEATRPEAASEIDLRALGAVLKRRRRLIIVPTVAAVLLVGLFVNVVTPRYTAESQVLLENQETFFTRPDRVAASEQVSSVDPEAVGSQVQLIASRDLARRAVRELKLQGDPEFDPSARGMGPVARVLVLLGLAHDPTQDTVEARILQTFSEKLTVYSPPKTRVITIQFQSKDPEVAARIANKMAELYLAEQSSAKRGSAKQSADALSGQIADLRVKLAKADAEREQYRAASGLLAGTNNMTISGQQLADINSDLSKARSAQADAQAKASLIRDLLRAGKAADVTEVVNNDLVRRVGEQRVTAQAQLAQESRTLLPGHPRIKELTAQVADLTAALKTAAKQAMTTLENDAKISGQRVANLEAVLTQQKKVAGTANGDEVRLRSLDRIAQSFKDQLDSSTTKYQEALSRQGSTATPADARIIARAVPPQEPSYPKKLPFILFGAVATLVFAIGFVIARELLGTPAAPASRVAVATVPVPAPIVAAPVPQAAPVLLPEEAVPEQVLSGKVLPTAAAIPTPDAAPVVAISARAVRDAAREESPPLARIAKPLNLHVNAVLETLRTFAQSAAASRGEPDLPAPDALPGVGVGWDGGVATRSPVFEPVAAPALDKPSPPKAEIDEVAARIVAAHVPGRGLHVVGASLGTGAGAADDLLALGRTLAERGRSIIVDLDASPLALVPLTGDGQGAHAVTALSGLSELLSGQASFAEVIHRDGASRLHFIPTGRCEADFRDFDLILDALSETYDFIILLAPAFPRSDIAKVMAPYADLVVLTGSANADAGMLAALEGALTEAGAREVLVTGAVGALRREPYVA